MRNIWRTLRLPTLVRRIIIAQMLLLTLLWCLFLTFVLWEDLRSPPILTGSKTYETLFTLVDSMDDRPQERTDVLNTLSEAHEVLGQLKQPGLSTCKTQGRGWGVRMYGRANCEYAVNFPAVYVHPYRI